uniref:Zinc finger homeobox protein 2 n=1 Tax=Geotrypetes seraphini TaxID=260995 RepID=A0A6P8PGX7_GEOSA|nr:zinc finger homeobox protein 2 [Geotrypetes seraphini]
MDTLKSLSVAGHDECFASFWPEDSSLHFHNPLTKDTPEPLSPSSTSVNSMRPSTELCRSHPGPEAASCGSNAVELTNGLGLASCPPPPKETPNPPLQSQKGTEKEDEEDQDDNSNAEEDAQDLQDCVYFSQDGSAYLLDHTDGSRMAGLPGLFNQCLPKGSPRGDLELAVPPAAISTLHVHQGFITDQKSQHTSAGGGGPPAFYTLHVTSVRLRSKENYLKQSKAAKNQDDPKENHEEEEEEEEQDQQLTLCEGNALPHGLKPLWICLLCKLSFHHGGSLATHATHLHQLEVLEEEQEVLESGRTSAIVQSLGNGRGPLLSFLLPKTNSISPHSAEAVWELPGSNGNLSDVAAKMFNRSVNVVDASAPGKMPANQTSSSLELGVLSGLLAEEDQDGSSESPATLFGELLPRTAPDTHLDPNPQSPKESGDPTEAKDLTVGELDWIPPFDGASLWGEMGEEETVEPEGAPVPEQLLTNQSVCESPVLPVQAHSHPKEDHPVLPACSHHGDETEDQSNSPKSVSHPSVREKLLAVEDPTKSYSPSERTGASGGPSSFSILTNDDYVPTSGPNAFQSLSLSNQMSMLHSRNSCKTLKCPRCNWHYKYQQTLDVHMKEKHPEAGRSHCAYCNSGQPHPRLARGESYNCGYKPYRCEACNYSTTTKGNLSIHMQSDKHLANLQGFQGPGAGQGPAVSTSGGNGSGTGSVSPPESSLPSPQDKQPKQKACWQCKVCNYETSISRNLRIHMTSEKHMQNTLLRHQGMPLGLPGLLQPGPDLYQYYGPQGLRQEKASIDSHLLLNGFHLSAANRKGTAAVTTTSPPGEILPQHLPSQPAPQVGLSSQETSTSPPSPEDPSLRVFRCLVCQAFTTDNLELLLYHSSLARSLPEHEWKEVSGDTHRCRLCSYGTQLKANFQLHLKTDKHAQKYQLAAHLHEGGVASATADLQLASLSPVTPPLHLRCNLCDFESNSKEKMRIHVRSGDHEENFHIYKFLMDLEGASCGDPGPYRCTLCDFQSSSRLGVLQHLRSPMHRENQAQWKLKLLHSGRVAEEGLAALERIISLADPALKEPGKNPISPAEPSTLEKEGEKKGENLDLEKSEIRSSSLDGGSQTMVFCCPYCSFVSQVVEQVRAHTISQHAVQPRFHCPLCQEQLMGRTNLRFHLTHIHNVVSECVEKLLLVATTVELTFTTKVLPVPNLTKDEESQKPTCSTPDLKPAKDSDDEPSSSTPGNPPESSCKNHPTEPGEEEAPLDKDLCKDHEEPNCITHDEEKSPSDPSCLLTCPWCQQRTESLPELKEHLENEHAELGGSEIQQLCLPQLEAASRVPEDEDESFSSAGCPPDPEGLEDRSVPVDHEATVATATSSFLVDPRQPLSYRKSTNFALDKFLDPSRPYKCTVCKESFTQKNILLVHYNSVSHLHKMKKAAIDPSLPSRAEVSGAQDKPYKCTTCRVSYNQSSTLEIHMRSVLHQTRSRVAKLEAASRGASDQSAGHEKADTEPSSRNDSPQKLDTVPSTASHEQADVSSAPPVEEPLTTEPTKKTLENQCLASSGLPFMPPQMQMTLDLHRHASLLQAPLFTPPVLPHFPLVPESLLKLQQQQQQQQQLLLPFYLHDLKVSPEMGLAGVSPVLSIQRSSPMAIGGGSVPKKSPVPKEDLQPVVPSPSISNAPAPSTESISHTAAEEEEEEEEEEDEDGEGTAEEGKTEVEGEQASNQDPEQPNNGAMPPPRIPTDVSRTAAKALLEDFGFELVIQYNEGKQPPPPLPPPQHQQHSAPVLPQPPIQMAPVQQQQSTSTTNNVEKLKCEACGKLFSNMLILKTHEEHVHRRFLPFEALCRYATQFRKSYDSMYPLRQTVAATSTEPSAPPTKTLPLETAVTQAAALPVPQLPIPLDFSVCPPFLMQSIPLQALPAILPSPPPPLPQQLPNVNTLVTTGLAKVSDSAEAEPTMESRSPRTRITPEQLKILWNYFDINNLPSEETVQKMAEHTGLAAKVVKHWFRNRLFKERQQDKDSPYNFNNPPASSMPLEEEEEEPGESATATALRPDRLGSRRFSRTKFTDYQFHALQSFFEASAYPKDSEVERLSQLLGLPSRVVVVWFQNARQKARKNAAEAPFQSTGKGQDPSGGGDRCVFNGNKQNLCKKCLMAYPCIFQLIGHLKKCYKDQLCDEDSEEAPGDAAASNLESTKCATNDSQNHEASPLMTTTQFPKASNSQEDPVMSVSDIQAQATPETSEYQEDAKVVQENKVDEMASHIPEVTPVQTEFEEETDELSKSSPKDSIEETKSFSTTITVPTEQPVLSPEATLAPSLSGDVSNIYSCEQCRATFANPELLGKHQSLHILASTQLPGSLLEPPLLMFDHSGPLLQGALLPSGPLPLAPSPLTDSSAAAQTTRKRKLEEEGLSPTESEAGYLGDEPPKDKRLRTTILPEQLEILHRWYMQDSNPTRKMLDCISEEVGLKKRVVQVWFQNTRARERKGQFRCVAPALPPAKPYTKFLSPVGKAEMVRETPVLPSTDTSPAVPPMAHRSPLVGVQEGLKRDAATFYGAVGMSLSNALVGMTEAFSSGNTPNVTIAPLLADNITNLLNPPPDAQEAEKEHRMTLEIEEASRKRSPPLPQEMEDLSDSSSFADPESPNPSLAAASRQGDGSMDSLGQRRFRTQMSSLQLKIMKACYNSYRTPTMQECEVLGSEIGLQKRVIQVWFQNARAKEKKAKLQGLAPPEFIVTTEVAPSPRGECAICNVKYDFYVSCRSHIFSRQHITRLKEAIQRQLSSEVKYYDTSAANSATQLKPPAATSSVSPGFSPAVGFQSTSGAVGATSLPRLGPLLLSGQGIPAPIGGLTPFNSGPPSSILGITASVAPALLPVPSLPSRPVPQKPPDQTSADPNAETSPEKQRSEGRVPPPPLPPPGKPHNLPEAPATVISVPRSKNLKSVKATITGGGGGGSGCAPLLGGQFLPFSLPGTPTLFSPQMQGAYFQQLYGMKKSLFPMNPVIPQTLIGLLPSSLLQPELPPKPMPEPALPSHASPTVDDIPSAPCQPTTGGPQPEVQTKVMGEDPLLLQSAGISTVDIAHKYLCRQCKAAFEEEGAAVAHQAASTCCFYGAMPMPPPLRVTVCTYHCLPCEVLLNGREALSEHLRSPAHQRSQLRQKDSTFAKEDVKIPHTDSSPKSVTTSAIVA